MDKSHRYAVEKKNFERAEFISPPKSELERFSRPKEENFPNAKYIWPFGNTRFHSYRIFCPKAKVIRAEAAFLCDNLFDLWLNGKQIVADTRHLSLTDITEYLAAGENNLHIRGYQSATYKTFSSAITGGRRLFYENGEKETVITDKSWLCAPSPLVENDLQYGERYDARLEKKNWCSSDAEGFVSVSSRGNTEYREMLLQNYPFVKKAAEREAKLLRILPDGSPMFDIGECVAGRARVKFCGLPEGKEIRIRYCERLADDQIMPENGAYTTVFYQNDCAPDGKSPFFLRNMDVYTAKGEETEEYECRSRSTVSTETESFSKSVFPSCSI